MEGFSAPETHGKWSLRASTTGELVFDNVKVPKLKPVAQQRRPGRTHDVPGLCPLRHCLEEP